MLFAYHIRFLLPPKKDLYTTPVCKTFLLLTVRCRKVLGVISGPCFIAPFFLEPYFATRKTTWASLVQA